MNVLNDLNGMLDRYRSEHIGQNPELIVMGNESFANLCNLQGEGFCQLEFNFKTNGSTFNGIRLLISNELDYKEISFY